MKSFCPYSQCSHLNLLTCLQGLDAFIIFFKNKTKQKSIRQKGLTRCHVTPYDALLRNKITVLKQNEISNSAGFMAPPPTSPKKKLIRVQYRVNELLALSKTSWFFSRVCLLCSGRPFSTLVKSSKNNGNFCQVLAL